MTICLDFTRPETALKLAQLPYDGQAMALIRRVDPLWKLDLGEWREFRVRIEREEEAQCPTCGCDCGASEACETKTVSVEARTLEEAEAIATQEHCGPEHGGWFFVEVVMPPPPTIKIPPSLLAWFEHVAEDPSHPLANGQGGKG